MSLLISRDGVFAVCRRVAACAAVAMLLPPLARAQMPSRGQLLGQVLDTTGQPLPDALVQVDGGREPLATRSGPDGRYSIALPAGTYTIRFSLPNFVTLLRRDVRVDAGQPRIENAMLFVAGTSSVVVTGRTTFRSLTSVSAQDELIGVADAASTGVITPAELNERARRRPAEALESVPGVVVSQHSGEGKANQYYLRGFNIDHGTDVALSVAGMPINLPTHGHGQGYADMNFLIPELVSGIQYRKGTYAADAGDFSVAGSIRVSYLNVLDSPLARIEAGMYGYRRMLAAASPRVGDGHLLVAAEAMGNDGPWDRPDAMRRWNGVVRYSQGTVANGFSLTALAYDARWNASDQIPRRAVAAGTLSRFGSLDDTNGGRTHRLGGILEWQRANGDASNLIELYAFDAGLDLFSNFTYFLDDPAGGDQFQQRDDRRVIGGRASRTWAAARVLPRSSVIVGADLRRDAIGTVGLYRTAARGRRSTVREDSVRQQSGAVHAEVQTRWSDAVRTTFAVRADLYAWDVTAGDPVNGGSRTDGIINPKVSVALGPWRRTEWYASAGGGFHSNDGRGATIRRDPVTGDPADPVDPLVRARGAEVGVRTMAIPGLHSTIALWSLWLDSELLFVGDAGTTAASRPSRRVGIEWDADYRAASWLSLDARAAYSNARFTDPSREGPHIPGAIETVASAGLTLTPASRWSGGLRWRYFGPRPLTEDGRVRSAASNLVSAEGGFQVSRAWRVKADVLNLFDSRSSDIDYYYTSRLPGEPAGGVDDIHFHPVEPFTVRLALVASF